MMEVANDSSVDDSPVDGMCKLVAFWIVRTVRTSLVLVSCVGCSGLSGPGACGLFYVESMFTGDFRILKWR